MEAVNKVVSWWKSLSWKGKLVVGLGAACIACACLSHCGVIGA